MRKIKFYHGFPYLKYDLNRYRLYSDFHVPDANVDPLKSKSISNSLVKAEKESSSAMDVDDEDEDREEFVHDDWEDRVDSPEHEAKMPPKNCVHFQHHHHHHRVSQPSSRTKDSLKEGRTYPQDLWFLLGKYIAPESIQTFGLLCRGSWTVLKTFQFWSALYERTYDQCTRSNPSEGLADHLKVDRENNPIHFYR